MKTPVRLFGHPAIHHDDDDDDGKHYSACLATVIALMQMADVKDPELAGDDARNTPSVSSGGLVSLYGLPVTYDEGLD